MSFGRLRGRQRETNSKYTDLTPSELSQPKHIEIEISQHSPMSTRLKDEI